MDVKCWDCKALNSVEIKEGVTKLEDIRCIECGVVNCLEFKTVVEATPF